MKKATSIIAALFMTAMFAMTFESCGKYEEGPNFSLKSKKGRLAREWVFDEYIDGTTGTSTPIPGDDYMEFKKDGGYVLNLGGFGFTGTWEFSSNKEEIYTSVDLGFFGTITDTSKILRLTSKELWFIDTDGSKDETHFKAK